MFDILNAPNNEMVRQMLRHLPDQEGMRNQCFRNWL